MNEELTALAEEFLTGDAESFSERLERESLRYSRQIGDSGVTVE